MPDLYIGATILWSPRYLAIFCLFSLVAVAFLRILAPRAFCLLGYFRIACGFLTVVVGCFLLLSSSMAKNFYDVLAALALSFPLMLLFTSCFLLPVIILLSTLNRLNVMSAMLLAVVLALLLILLWELNLGPELSNGFSRWIKGIPYVASAVGGAVATFCFGARIGFASMKFS